MVSISLPICGGSHHYNGLVVLFRKREPGADAGLSRHRPSLLPHHTHIIVVVAAFRESAGTGFLTLCVPFYALYFVFKMSDNDTLKVLYSVAVLINLVLRFIPKLQ